MTVIDFRAGVTLSLLLSTVMKKAVNFKDLMTEAARVFGNHGQADNHLPPSGIFTAPDPDTLIRSLHTACAPLPGLSSADAADRAGTYGPGIQELASLAKSDLLDPFEISSYILLSFLLREQRKAVTVLAPRIGSDSQDQVFSILTQCRLRLIPGAPALAPFCAAVLVKLFSPFLAEAPAFVLTHSAVVVDPLDPTCTARVFLTAEAEPETESVAVIQANIDDMTPEILGRTMPLMLAHGALDFTIIPAIMKKGRPGFLVEIIARPADRAALEELLLCHTTTFGVRSSIWKRRILDRRVEQFDSTFGRIRVKQGFFSGRLLRSVPEFEDVAALSEKTGIPLVSLFSDIQNEIARARAKESV